MQVSGSGTRRFGVRGSMGGCQNRGWTQIPCPQKGTAGRNGGCSEKEARPEPGPWGTGEVISGQKVVFVSVLQRELPSALAWVP